MMCFTLMPVKIPNLLTSLSGISLFHGNNHEMDFLKAKKECCTLEELCSAKEQFGYMHSVLCFENAETELSLTASG